MASSPLNPPATIAFIGLGQMGVPMAKCLLRANFKVQGFDPADTARAALSDAGGIAAPTAIAAVAGADVLITMLPTGAIVRDVLLGNDGVAAHLPKGAIIIDMSSSSPTDTTATAAALAKIGVPLLDAPVSGGVKRAVDGSLAIMVGGDAALVERVRPVLAAMGKAIVPTGPIGSGHAMKALNNYVSAAGLIAASEALLVGRTFGIEPNVIVDVLNASTGRNNSTEVKMKPFVISEAFNSGFSYALMGKDLGIAADLAQALDLDVPQAKSVLAIWEAGKKHLAATADHTEIYSALKSAATKAK